MNLKRPIALHPNKLQNLQAMSRGDRFDYFLHKVSDCEEVWGLHDNGWATSGFADGEAVPFWPEAALAMSCATAEWSGYEARSIPLGDFLAKWLPGMQADRRVCQVFPVPQCQGWVMTADDLARALWQVMD